MSCGPLTKCGENSPSGSTVQGEADKIRPANSSAFVPPSPTNYNYLFYVATGVTTLLLGPAFLSRMVAGSDGASDAFLKTRGAELLQEAQSALDAGNLKEAFTNANIAYNLLSRTDNRVDTARALRIAVTSLNKVIDKQREETIYLYMGGEDAYVRSSIEAVVENSKLIIRLGKIAADKYGDVIFGDKEVFAFREFANETEAALAKFEAISAEPDLDKAMENFIADEFDGRNGHEYSAALADRAMSEGARLFEEGELEEALKQFERSKLYWKQAVSRYLGGDAYQVAKYMDSWARNEKLRGMVLITMGRFEDAEKVLAYQAQILESMTPMTVGSVISNQIAELNAFRGRYKEALRLSSKEKMEKVMAAVRFRERHLLEHELRNDPVFGRMLRAQRAFVIEAIVDTWFRFDEAVRENLKRQFRRTEARVPRWKLTSRKPGPKIKPDIPVELAKQMAEQGDVKEAASTKMAGVERDDKEEAKKGEKKIDSESRILRWSEEMVEAGVK